MLKDPRAASTTESLSCLWVALLMEMKVTGKKEQHLLSCLVLPRESTLACMATGMWEEGSLKEPESSREDTTLT